MLNSAIHFQAIEIVLIILNDYATYVPVNKIKKYSNLSVIHDRLHGIEVTVAHIEKQMWVTVCPLNDHIFCLSIEIVIA